jgi:hypothetical protein
MTLLLCFFSSLILARPADRLWGLGGTYLALCFFTCWFSHIVASGESLNVRTIYIGLIRSCPIVSCPVQERGARTWTWCHGRMQLYPVDAVHTKVPWGFAPTRRYGSIAHLAITRSHRDQEAVTELLILWWKKSMMKWNDLQQIFRMEDFSDECGGPCK